MDPSQWADWMVRLGSTVAGTGAFLPLMGRLRQSRSRDELLESDLRRKILELVEETPGLPIGELMLRAGLGWGTLYHHLSQLAHAGLIRSTTGGRRRLIYPATTPSGPDSALVDSLVRGRTSRAVALAVVAEPGLTVLELSERTGQSPRAVYYHVRRLVDAGLVESGSSTRYRGLVATPRLREAIETSTPEDDDAA